MNTFSATLTMMGMQIGAFLPRLLSAIIVLIVGIIIAVALSKIVEKICDYIKLDQHLLSPESRAAMQKYNIRYTFKDALAAIVRWFFYLITLVAVSDILQITQLTQFLLSVTYYIPNVIVAIIILAIGIFAARLVGALVDTALRAARMGERTGRVLSGLTRTAIIIFAVMAALLQLGIAPSLIQILFAGVVVMLAIAGGLAFGLGGKDKAHEILDDASREMTGPQGMAS